MYTRVFQLGTIVIPLPEQSFFIGGHGLIRTVLLLRYYIKGSSVSFRVFSIQGPLTPSQLQRSSLDNVSRIYLSLSMLLYNYRLLYRILWFFSSFIFAKEINTSPHHPDPTKNEEKGVCDRSTYWEIHGR